MFVESQKPYILKEPMNSEWKLSLSELYAEIWLNSRNEAVTWRENEVFTINEWVKFLLLQYQV